MEKYWKDKETRGEIKETRARLRCGSIGREWNKGFKDSKCRLCKVNDETLVHICSCSEVQRAVQEKVVDRLKEWLATDSEDDLERKINRELSMGKPVIALCEYVAEFERVALKESEWKPKKEKGKMWWKRYGICMEVNVVICKRV